MKPCFQEPRSRATPTISETNFTTWVENARKQVGSGGAENEFRNDVVFPISKIYRCALSDISVARSSYIPWFSQIRGHYNVGKWADLCCCSVDW